MKRTLIVREGSTEREVPLSGTVVVGRDADCGVCLNDPRLSRRHAEFVTAGELVSVRDLQSRNGIEINGVRATSAVLRPGDVVTLADVSITVAAVVEDAAAGVALPPDDRTVLRPMASLLGARRPSEPRHAPAPAPVAIDDDATRIGGAVDLRHEDAASLPPASQAPMRGGQSLVADSAAPSAAPSTGPAGRRPRITWSDLVMLRVAALAVLVGGVALATAWLSQRSLLTMQGEARATAIVGWLSAEGATKDGATLDAAVQAIGREPGVIAALIVATDGRVLAPTLRMAEPLGRIPGLDLAPADVVRLRVAEQNGRLELVKPVAGGRAVAWLTYNASEAGGGLGLALGLTFIVAAAGTFLMAGAIRRATFAGLAQFKEDVELVMSGQLAKVEDTLGARPLEDLAHVVNYLVARTKAGGALTQMSFDGGGAADASQVSRAPLREAWIVTDASFRVSEASASITPLLGVRADTMVGKHLLDAVPDKNVSEAILKCLSGVSLHGRDETIIAGVTGAELGECVVSVNRKGKLDPITIRFTPRITGGRA